MMGPEAGRKKALAGSLDFSVAFLGRKRAARGHLDGTECWGIMQA